MIPLEQVTIRRASKDDSDSSIISSFPAERLWKENGNSSRRLNVAQFEVLERTYVSEAVYAYLGDLYCGSAIAEVVSSEDGEKHLIIYSCKANWQKGRSEVIVKLLKEMFIIAQENNCTNMILCNLPFWSTLSRKLRRIVTRNVSIKIA